MKHILYITSTQEGVLVVDSLEIGLNFDLTSFITNYAYPVEEYEVMTHKCGASALREAVRNSMLGFECSNGELPTKQELFELVSTYLITVSEEHWELENDEFRSKDNRIATDYL